MSQRTIRVEVANEMRPERNLSENTASTEAAPPKERKEATAANAEMRARTRKRASTMSPGKLDQGVPIGENRTQPDATPSPMSAARIAMPRLNTSRTKASSFPYAAYIMLFLVVAFISGSIVLAVL